MLAVPYQHKLQNNMITSTIILYFCGLTLGAAVARNTYLFCNYSVTEGKRTPIMFFITLFFLLFNGAPFFLNSILRPTNMGAGYILRNSMPDIVASFLMLGIGLAYIATLIFCLRKEPRMKKLVRNLVSMLVLFTVWSAVSLWYIIPHIVPC